MFVWAIFEKYYVQNIFVTLSQQNLGCKFLLVLIWTYYWNYFLFINNNLLFRICCENIVNIVFLAFFFSTFNGQNFWGGWILFLMGSIVIKGVQVSFLEWSSFYFFIFFYFFFIFKSGQKTHVNLKLNFF